MSASRESPGSTAGDAIKALHDEGFAGENDWRLLKQQEAHGLEEAGAVERLARKEKMIDPNYYPKIRGAVGIFKVKIGKAANHLPIERAWRRRAGARQGKDR